MGVAAGVGAVEAQAMTLPPLALSLLVLAKAEALDRARQRLSRRETRARERAASASVTARTDGRPWLALWGDE